MLRKMLATALQLRNLGGVTWYLPHRASWGKEKWQVMLPKCANYNSCTTSWISNLLLCPSSAKNFSFNYGWYPENGCGLRLGQIVRNGATSKQFEKKYPV